MLFLRATVRAGHELQEDGALDFQSQALVPVPILPADVMANEFYRLHIIGTGLFLLLPDPARVWWLDVVWLVGVGWLLWGMRADSGVPW